MTSPFRRAAHARLVTDPRRGRLMLQLAYLAGAEQEAIWDPYAWPRVRREDLPAEQREQLEHLCALEVRLWREARRLGVRGPCDPWGESAAETAQGGEVETEQRREEAA